MDTDINLNDLYKIIGDHGCTGNAMSVTRHGRKEAERTARFMAECGYVNIEIRSATKADLI